MVKIIESEYRVLDFDSEDVMLTDIGGTGLPVHVSKYHETYSDKLQTQIDKLEIGNIIEAEIQSESITQQDDFWKFVDLKTTECSRFHFIKDSSTYPSAVVDLINEVKGNEKNSAHTRLKSDGEPIGYITVTEDDGYSFWRVVNSYESDLRELDQLASSPHEVIYSRTNDNEYLVFYYLAEKGTRIAKAIIESNQ